MPTDTTPSPRSAKKAPASAPAKTSIKTATIKTTSSAQSAKATKSTRKRPAEVTAPIVDPEYRRALIAEAAYLRAERRNFAPGYEVDDWLNAESEVDTRLTLGVVPPAK